MTGVGGSFQGHPFVLCPRMGLTALLCSPPHPPGPPFLQLSQDRPGTAAGGLAPAHQAYHVLLQTGERQVRGVGAADTSGAVCAQGERAFRLGGTVAGEGGSDRALTTNARGTSQVIRDILLIGHRQAFAWVDEWCGESVGPPQHCW